MVSITRALEQVKSGLGAMLEPAAIERICRACGHTWRDGCLTPWATIHLFILQIIHGNTACTHLPHLSGKHFTASAYCQARTRLPLDVLATLVANAGAWMQRATQGGAGLWRGLRTILIDGSSFSMPDTPALQARFGQPGAQKKGCGFPVAHLLAAFDGATGLIVDLIAAPLRTHDMANVHRIIPYLLPGDLVVADRGFCSYAHFALLAQAGMYGCFRMHQRRMVNFASSKRANRRQPYSKRLKKFGKCDQLVEWRKPQQAPRWLDEDAFARLPETIQIRELAFDVSQPGFRVRNVILATTLLDAVRYPADELAVLYRTRWQAETNLRHLKTTMGMETLKCKRVEGVLKELWVYALVYNLVRIIMLKAAHRQQVGIERISFADALRWLAVAVHHAQRELRSLVVLPNRPDRIEPRVVKRRPKSYSLMTKPRSHLRQLLLTQRDVA
jgi:hypothetical protein